MVKFCLKKAKKILKIKSLQIVYFWNVPFVVFDHGWAQVTETVENKTGWGTTINEGRKKQGESDIVEVSRNHEVCLLDILDFIVLLHCSQS